MAESPADLAKSEELKNKANDFFKGSKPCFYGISVVPRVMRESL